MVRNAIVCFIGCVAIVLLSGCHPWSPAPAAPEVPEVPEFVSMLKGSDTALSIEPYFTFLSTPTDNKMAGFGWFRNGFGLADAATSCIFASVFPVSGDIRLNSGSLHLATDLLFHNETILHTFGKIYGYNHHVDFSSSVKGLGTVAHPQVFNNAMVTINSDILISGPVIFQGNCSLEGNGKRLIIDDNGYLLVDAGAKVTLKGVRIEGISEEKIRCQDDTSELVLDNMQWVQDADAVFTKGTLFFHNHVDFLGPHTFTYESKKTSIITRNAIWRLSDEMTLCLGQNNGVEPPPGDTRAVGFNPLYFEDKTATLHLQNATLASGEQGIKFTRGTLLCGNKVFFDIASTNATNGVSLGDGTAAGDMSFILDSGASVHFLRGDFVYDITTPTGLTARNSHAHLICCSPITFHIKQDLILANMHIVDKNQALTMVVDAGKSVYYDNLTFAWEGVNIAMTGYRDDASTFCLSGDHELFLKSGRLNSSLLIKNGGNVISGEGSLNGEVTLSDRNAAVACKLSGLLVENVILAGGTVSLLQDLSFQQGSLFLGSGTVDLASHDLCLGPVAQTWAGSIDWKGDNATIKLHSRIDLTGTWRISGICTILGGSNILHLGTTGEIVVEKGSTLLIRETKLRGLSGNNVRCLGSDSLIVYADCQVRMDGDYSFTQGRLEVDDHLKISGAYTFAYQSVQTSTIRSYTKLIFDRGSTFSFDPLWDARFSPAEWELARNFLAFVDETSVLELKGATLHVTATSLKLKKGTLRIKDNSYIVSELDGKFHLEEGLILGDNNAVDDMVCEISGDAQLQVTSGALSYKNMQSYSWSMKSDRSKLAIASGARLKLHQTLDSGSGITSFDGGSVLARVVGKKLLGPVHIGGRILYEVCYN